MTTSPITTVRTCSLMAIGLLALTLAAGAHNEPGDEPDARLPISVRIARKPKATVDDGYRLVARLAQTHGRIDAGTPVDELPFDQLQTTLLDLDLVPDSSAIDADDELERDHLAYITASYLDIKPGLLTSIFGMTRRYAYREMQHRGLMVQGQPRQTVSGSELLSVLTRIAIQIDRRENQ